MTMDRKASFVIILCRAIGPAFFDSAALERAAEMPFPGSRQRPAVKLRLCRGHYVRAVNTAGSHILRISTNIACLVKT
jgi:hypothetical protein